MFKSKLFLGTILSLGFVCGFAVYGHANPVQNNQEEQTSSTEQKTIEVPIYSKDDVIPQNGVLIKKSDKKPISGILQVKSNDGKVVAKTLFFNGLPHGGGVTFYPNGQVNTLEKYTQGRLHGKSVSYYDDGKLMNETYFYMGRPEGKTTSYYQNGKVRFETTYKNGKKMVMTKPILTMAKLC